MSRRTRQLRGDVATAVPGVFGGGTSAPDGWVGGVKSSMDVQYGAELGRCPLAGGLRTSLEGYLQYLAWRKGLPLAKPRRGPPDFSSRPA